MKKLITICFKKNEKNRRFNRTFLAMLVCVASIVSLSFDATGAVSAFDTDDEGWSVTGDVHGFQWRPDVGNPPGSVLGIDNATGDTWGFIAPSKFLGNKEAAYGHTLSYDIYITNRDSDPWLSPDIALTGGGISINWFGSPPPANVWTSYNILLTESAGWRKSDNTIPTAAEMKQALGDLTVLYIRAEYKTGSDQAYLDNVVLIPEPATVAILSIGALSLIRRKK